MDWEFTNVTSSLTKVTKTSIKTPAETKKAKRVFPVIIEQRKKKVCFRYGIVSHKVNKRIFLFARRPVVAFTTNTTAILSTTTTTTIPKTTIEKIDSEKNSSWPKTRPKIKAFSMKFGTKITLRNMQKYDGLTNGVCNEIISIRFNINVWWVEPILLWWLAWLDGAD